MKNIIWIMFVVVALIWTALAFLVSGLAGWTSETIESGRLATATQQITQASEAVTRSVTQTLTETSGQATERVAATVTQPVSEAAAALAAAASQIPSPPPVPEWANQWLPPALVQSIKRWGAQAQAVVVASDNYVANAAPQIAAQAAGQVATTAGHVITQAAQATQLAQATFNQTMASTVNSTTAAVAPLIANAADWLVLIVWIIWGIGMFVGLLGSLVAQWLVGRFVGKPA